MTTNSHKRGGIAIPNLIQQLTQELQAQTQYGLQLKELIRKQQALIKKMDQRLGAGTGNYEEIDKEIAELEEQARKLNIL